MMYIITVVKDNRLIYEIVTVLVTVNVRILHRFLIDLLFVMINLLVETLPFGSSF